MTHPLDMLTGDEISLASRDRAGRRPLHRRRHVRARDPARARPRTSSRPPAPADRARREVQLVTGPELGVIEIVVSLTRQQVLGLGRRRGDAPDAALRRVRRTRSSPRRSTPSTSPRSPDAASPTSTTCRSTLARGCVRLRRRRTDRRIARCISFLRTDPQDNGYARPIEGLIVHFDLGRKEVIEVIDHGVAHHATQHARYFAPDNEPLRTDLKPIEITQPDGPSFTVDGNLVRVAEVVAAARLRPVRGSGAAPGDLRRRRARAVDPAPRVDHRDGRALRRPERGQGWKNAFDVGEWGLGRMTQSLTLGCDCLGEIHYFDATLTKEDGEPYVIENAICMHEEDYGILWKHVDLFGGTSEVRRSRRLVVSFISTVGNYEYGFFWYFYLDGNIQLEVKLTGIVSPMAIEPGDRARVRQRSSRPASPRRTTSTCSARGSTSTSTAPTNEVYEVEAERVPTGPENPWGNAFRAKKTRLESELAARRETDSATSRSWRIVNPEARNGLGQPTAYKLIPTMSTPTLLAQPDSSVGPARRLRVPQPLGHAVPRRRAPRRRQLPEPARRRRRPPPLDRGRPFARRRPTSSSGTASASRTSCGRRTGRSCRWSTPASCSARTASSTATPALDVPPSPAGHCHAD